MSMVTVYEPDGHGGVLTRQVDETELLHTVEDKIRVLWERADKYHDARLDGKGLAAVIGAGLQAAITSHPHGKCDDIIAWSRTLWADYEQRRTAIEAGGAVDLDFSCHGELPWRVVEAVNETEGGAA